MYSIHAIASQFMRSIWIGRALRAAFISVGQRSLIAMVSIGDEHLFILHLLLHGVDQPLIVNAPDSVEGLIFVEKRDVGVFFHAGFEESLDRIIGIAVKHEDLTEMCARGPQEVQAVCSRLGKGLLVAMHHAIRIVMDSSQRNQATTFLQFARAGDRRPSISRPTKPSACGAEPLISSRPRTTQLHSQPALAASTARSGSTTKASRSG